MKKSNKITILILIITITASCGSQENINPCFGILNLTSQYYQTNGLKIITYTSNTESQTCIKQLNNLSGNANYQAEEINYIEKDNTLNTNELIQLPLEIKSNIIINKYTVPDYYTEAPLKLHFTISIN